MMVLNALGLVYLLMAWKTAYASDVAAGESLILTSFTWVESVSWVESNTWKAPNENLQVCFEYSHESEAAVLTFTADGVEYSYEGASPSRAQGITCYVFGVEPDNIAFQDTETYAVYVEPTRDTGFAKFAFTLQPDQIHVDRAEGVELSRVFGVEADDLVNSEACVVSGVPECYLSEEVERLCISPTSEINVCDETFDTNSVNETTDVSLVELTYDDTATINVSSPSAPLTILLERDGIFTSCSDSSCQLPNFSPGTSLYTLSVIEEDNYHVSSSRQLMVQDVNLKIIQVSPDTIEVSREGSTITPVTIAPPPQNGSYDSVQCRTDAGSLCVAYFMGLEKDAWAKYQVSTDDTEEEVTVKVTANISEPYISYGIIDVTEMTHSASSNDYSSSATEVCISEGSLARPTLYKLIIIDVLGVWASTNQTKLSSSSCFDKMDMPNMKSSELCRVLVNIDNKEAGQSDVYLFRPEFEQMGQTSSRVTWNNKNSGEYYAGSVHSEDPMQQSSIRCRESSVSCEYYIRGDEAAITDTGTFSFTEKAAITQITTMEITMEEIPELKILTPFRIRHDGRLLVCFETEADTPDVVGRCELGVELDTGELVSNDHDAVVVKDSGDWCARTSDKVSVGAYATLWAVVVLHDNEDIKTQSGEETDNQNIYLLANPSVYVLIQYNEDDSADLLTSWNLVSSSQGLDQYHTRLVDAGTGDVLMMHNITADVSSDSYSVEGAGRYTVCVRASAGAIVSEEVCSYSVRVEFDNPVPPPEEVGVTDVNQFQTSSDDVMVSWSVDNEEVSSIFFNWTTTNQVFSSDNPSVNFIMVPASQGSVRLNLDEGSWDVCMTPVSRQSTPYNTSCSMTIVGNSTVLVDPPTNLEVFGDSIQWDPQDDADLYYLEWISSTAVGHVTTDQTSVVASEVIPAGQWDLFVYSIAQETDGSYISEPSDETEYVLDGILFELQQTGLREIGFTWDRVLRQESVTTYGLAVKHGPVYLDDMVKVTCSDDCYYTFEIPEATQADTYILEVAVLDDNDESIIEGTTKFSFEDIQSVSYLEFDIIDTFNVSLTWSDTDDALLYNVSLYDEQRSLITNIRSPQPKVLLNTDGSVPVDQCSAEVQGCTSDTSCGDRTSVNIRPPTDPNDSNVLAIVLSSVLAGIILLVIIGAIMYKVQKDKSKKSKPDDVVSVIEKEDVEEQVAAQDDVMPTMNPAELNQHDQQQQQNQQQQPYQPQSYQPQSYQPQSYQPQSYQPQPYQHQMSEDFVPSVPPDWPPPNPPQIMSYRPRSPPRRSMPPRNNFDNINSAYDYQPARYNQPSPPPRRRAPVPPVYSPRSPKRAERPPPTSKTTPQVPYPIPRVTMENLRRKPGPGASPTRNSRSPSRYDRASYPHDVRRSRSQEYAYRQSYGGLPRSRSSPRGGRENLI